MASRGDSKETHPDENVLRPPREVPGSNQDLSDLLRSRVTYTVDNGTRQGSGAEQEAAGFSDRTAPRAHNGFNDLSLRLREEAQKAETRQQSSKDSGATTLAVSPEKKAIWVKEVRERAIQGLEDKMRETGERCNASLARLQQEKNVARDDYEKVKAEEDRKVVEAKIRLDAEKPETLDDLTQVQEERKNRTHAALNLRDKTIQALDTETGNVQNNYKNKTRSLQKTLKKLRDGWDLQGAKGADRLPEYGQPREVSDINLREPSTLPEYSPRADSRSENR